MFDLKSMDKRLLIFGGLFTTSNRLQILMDQTIEDLTAKQWFVIAILELFKEPPSLIQLANACDSSYQNIKQIVLKLEKKGFVKLESNKNDKRAKSVVMTSKIKTWSEQNKEMTEEFVDSMFIGLTQKEIDDFSNTLLKIYEKLGNMKEEIQVRGQ